MDSIVSPMNSSRIGSRRPAGIEVHDAAADAELAGFVDRILAGVPGLGEQFGERRRRDVLARRQRQRRAHQPLGLRQARQQRRRRRDEHRAVPDAMPCSARARAEAMSKCGSSPRYGSTSCDGNGRTARSTSASDSPSSAAKKNRASTVIRSTSASVGTTDDRSRAPGGHGGEHRLGRATSGPRRGERARPSRAAGGRLQQRAKRQRAGSVGRHELRQRFRA